MDLKINYDGCLPDEKKKVMYLLIQASTSKPHPVLSLLSAVWAWIPGKYALYLIRVIGSSCGLYLNWNKCWNTCRARRLLTGHLQSCLVAGVFHASRCLPVIPNRHHLKIAKCVRDVSWNQIKGNVAFNDCLERTRRKNDNWQLCKLCLKSARSGQ